MDLTSGKARVLEGAGQLKGKLPVHSSHHGSGASGEPSSVLSTFHGLSPSTPHLSGVCAEPIVPISQMRKVRLRDSKSFAKFF